MLTKTVAFGTVRAVEVLDVGTILDNQVLTCLDVSVDGCGREGYVLVAAPGTYVSTRGDRGVITFTPGGPTGGHWVFSPAGGKGGAS